MAFGQQTGTIKRIFVEKGFGFIKPDDGSEDLFFHRSCLQRTAGARFDDLQEGMAVDFTPSEGPKGPRAVDVLAHARRS